MREKKSGPTQGAELPPHNDEAEEAVLGSVLVDPHVLAEVSAIIQPRDFSSPLRRAIYEAMLAVGPDALNEITVAQKLQDVKMLKEVGGRAYLSQLVLQTPTSMHAVHYANIVHRLSYCRELIEASGKIAQIAYKGDKEIESVFTEVYKLVVGLYPDKQASLVLPVDHANQLTEFALNDRTKMKRLSLGYENVDAKVGGIYPGNMVVIGARPGVGKSQVLQEIVDYNVMAGKKVLVASAEMTLQEWDERSIAMEAGVSIHDQRTRPLTDKEQKKVLSLIARIAETHMIFMQGKVTISTIVNQATFLRDTLGLDLIAVDYVQLLADSGEGENIREKVGFVSRALKRLARDCDCPLIVTSQLSRKVEERTDKRPVLSDLKETSDLEQDADYVLLLHRPELYWDGKRQETKEEGLLHVYISKVRQGGHVGRAILQWSTRDNRYYGLQSEIDQVRDEQGALL